MTTEPGLDESADPQELVVADLPAIGGAAGHLGALAAALERTADGLRGIETGHWSGAAADAFRARFDESPARWLTGADAFADAATACDAFGRTVQRSREQAARAAELYRSGQQASDAAVRERDAAVADADARLVAGGPPPEPLPPFTDPGEPMREQAVAMLAAARRDRDAAGADAAQVVRAAAASAPEPPSGIARGGAEVADLMAEGDRYLAGLGEGAESILRSVRALNPLDQWNVTHPASYVDTVSSTVAGAVSAQLHPADLLKGVVGTGWGSDPAGALGRAIPGVALSVATGGAGGVAGAAGRGTAKAGGVVPHPSHQAGHGAPGAADARGGDPPDTRPERPPPKTEDSPDLPYRAELSPWYENEQYGLSLAFPGREVKYFDDVDRENARLTVHDGRLYDSRGKLFDTAAGESFWSPDEPMSIFVMDPKGNLYVSLEQAVGRLHHSSLIAGAPVAGAGEIAAVDGRVVVMSEESGHYKPLPEGLDQVMEYLRQEGVDLDETEVRRRGD